MTTWVSRRCTARSRSRCEPHPTRALPPPERRERGTAALYSRQPFRLRPAPDASATAAGAAVAVIDDPLTTHPAAYQPGQIVRDTVMLLIAGDTAATSRLARAAAVLPTGSELVRAA